MKYVLIGLSIILVGLLFITLMNSNLLKEIIYFSDEETRVISASVIYLSGIIGASICYLHDKK